MLASAQLDGKESQLDGLRASGSWSEVSRVLRLLERGGAPTASAAHRSAAAAAAYRLTVAGECEAAARRRPEARALYARALAVCPDYPDAAVLLAALAIEGGWPRGRPAAAAAARARKRRRLQRRAAAASAAAAPHRAGEDRAAAAEAAAEAAAAAAAASSAAP